MQIFTFPQRCALAMAAALLLSVPLAQAAATYAPEQRLLTVPSVNVPGQGSLQAQLTTSNPDPTLRVGMILQVVNSQTTANAVDLPTTYALNDQTVVLAGLVIRAADGGLRYFDVKLRGVNGSTSTFVVESMDDTQLGRATTGTVGPKGETGTQGVQGAQGLSGAPGSAGAQGVPGPVGAAGTNGANGLNGAAGAVGATGPTGVAGPTGASGATGAAGPSGAVGATGATGAAGSVAITAYTGATINVTGGFGASSATATCVAPKTAVSGGCRRLTGNGLDVSLSSSYMSGSNTWTCEYAAWSNGSVQATVYCQ